MLKADFWLSSRLLELSCLKNERLWKPAEIAGRTLQYLDILRLARIRPKRTEWPS